jgi:light-regulated signal transduction histidine kinase (bacteriophytochrome)
MRPFDAELDVAAADPEVMLIPACPSCCAVWCATCWKTRGATADGEVRVSVRRLGTQAVLRVSDRGPGVPPAERERIFEPFYRLPGASEREGGVGLGLALVKSIAQRHGGVRKCEDAEGGGALFCGATALADVRVNAGVSPTAQAPRAKL